MAIDLVTKFAPYVDEKFINESKKSILTNNDFSWDGAHSIKLYKVTTGKMNDYDREGTGSGATGSRYGSVENLNATTEELPLKKDRSFTFAVDKMDADETAQQLQSATALARQQREVIIPEVDLYTYTVMTTKAGTKPASVALTEANIYDEIIKGTEALDDAEVPETERHLTVTPAVYRMLKKNPDINMSDTVSEEMKKKGVIAYLDGMAVLKVTKSKLPTKFGFMISHPSATVAPTKLEDFTVHQNPPGISGDLVEGRIIYDAFVLENKAKAIYYMENKTE